MYTLIPNNLCNYYNPWSEFIEVVAPMAGITDGKFCKKLAAHGFDLVTIGGYNVDAPTIAAGHQIVQRGRREFDVPQGEIMGHIDRQTQIIRHDNSWRGMISVNVRSTTPEPVIEISKFKGVDVVEINAHCRQVEITDLGCGQALLRDSDRLHKFTQEVVKRADSKVSVKIRANVPGVDDISVAQAVENAGADFIHVDAMKPGYDTADYDIITSIKENTDIFLIGNNSIRDVESAHEMLFAGADGISMARALIGGEVPFDLSLI